MLGSLIGVPQRGLGHLLGPIQAYCIAKKLPPLTSIVVGKEGLPGTGFIGAADVVSAQQKVFKHPWNKYACPSPEQFAEHRGGGTHANGK